jgi:outer membrane protein assembly factor BamB
MKETTMSDNSERRLEQDLDNWWDAVTAGLHPLSDPEPLRGEISTARYVAARHIGVAPDPLFARGLKDKLMQRATIPAPVAEVLTTSIVSGEHTSRRSWRSFWPEQRRRVRSLAELAAVAALVLMLSGIAFGGGPFGALHDLLPLSQDQTADTGPTGMYRGNAARTGVMPGTGVRGQPALKWKQVYGDHLPGLVTTVSPGRMYLAVDSPNKVVAVDTATGDAVWSTPTGDLQVSGAPAIGNGFVYLTTMTDDETGGPNPGALIALDVATGAEKWRYPTDASIQSSPALANGTVYISTRDGKLMAVDATTGQMRWSFDIYAGTPPTDIAWYIGRLTSLAPSSPTVANGVVYVGNNAGQVIAIDADSGTEKWRFQTDGMFSSALAFADNRLYFASVKTDESAGIDPENSWVYALDATNGNRLWQKQVGMVEIASPVVVDGRVFMEVLDRHVISEGGHTDSVWALDAKTGGVVWKYDGGANSYFYDVVYAGGILYVPNFNGLVYAFDARDGHLVWRADTADQAIVATTAVDDLVITVALNGTVYALGSAPTGATPEASPAAAIDVSGLGPCNPPPGIQPADAIQTPVSGLTWTLFPDRIPSDWPTYPDLLPEEVPSGPQASDEAIAGIEETLVGMANCDRDAASIAELYRFFTGDYFRRMSDHAPNGHYSNHVIYQGMDRPFTQVDHATELPDGRVGVYVKTGESDGTYAIFAEENGHWLVDEEYRVTPELWQMG